MKHSYRRAGYKPAVKYALWIPAFAGMTIKKEVSFQYWKDRGVRSVPLFHKAIFNRNGEVQRDHPLAGI